MQQSTDWKHPSKIGSHRGNKVHAKVLALEQQQGLPQPPSNPNSDVSEVTDSQASIPKVKLSKTKKRRFGFNGKKFVSNLPSLSSSKGSTNKATEAK